MQFNHFQILFCSISFGSVLFEILGDICCFGNILIFTNTYVVVVVSLVRRTLSGQCPSYTTGRDGWDTLQKIQEKKTFLFKFNNSSIVYSRHSIYCLLLPSPVTVANILWWNPPNWTLSNQHWHPGIGPAHCPPTDNLGKTGCTPNFFWGKF